MRKEYPAFGPILRQFRQERGLSQEELAERMGMASHAHLSRLESGHKQPTVEMLFRAADAFGIKAWEILKAMEER